MIVNKKGQITIPKALRVKFGMSPGCNVEFRMAGDALTLRKVTAHRRAGEIIQRMRGAGGIAMSTDEIMALTRGPR